MIALYFDENSDRPIARGLRKRGVDVLTAQEDHRRHTPDPILLDRALDLNRVMYSQDVDMVVEAVRRLRAGEPFAGLVYAAKDLPYQKSIDDLELIAKAMDNAAMENLIINLPL